MRIKTFQGRSLEDVLPEIRHELGPDAVVLGQRQKVDGGVGGFFGKRVVEVTAADRMPTDEQLVALESGGDDTGSENADASGDASTTERLRRAMSASPATATHGASAPAPANSASAAPNGGTIDLVDGWDPGRDEELAAEYGRVLEHARRADGDVAGGTNAPPSGEPRVRTAAEAAGFEAFAPALEAAQRAAPPIPSWADSAADPAAQARSLAARAHDSMRAAADRVEPALQTYAPPVPLPRSEPPRTTTLSASVADAPSHRAPAPSVDDAIAEALASTADVRTMAALRNAMQMSRLHAPSGRPSVDDAIQAAADEQVALLCATGVDDDVAAAIVEAAIHHGMAFGAAGDVASLVRTAVEQHLPVRSGFPRLGRSWRMALVGPSSAGKTSTVARIAEAYRDAGMSVGIVALVGTSASQHPEREARLHATRVDVRQAATPQQAAEAASAFTRHDLVLVDTPGSAYLDPAALRDVQAALGAMGVDDVHVVVPLTTSTREAAGIVEAYRVLGANRLVVTKLDESRFTGQLVNFGFRLGLPMTYLSHGPATDGRDARQTLRAASARDMAQYVLGAEHAH